MNDIVKKASIIPTLTTINERELLSNLASKVPAKGLIVEIGALYGGVTAVLALSAPEASVVTIDNFSWCPPGFPETSRETVIENMKYVGADNVSVITGTSQEVFLTWGHRIDLLWIDGGHSFKYVYFDLYNYGKLSNVIALHDYGNEAWPDIKKAIDIFLAKEKEWRFDNQVDMVAVLRRKV